MAKTTESVLGLAVMRALATQPKGEATVRTLIKLIPEFVNLTEEDQKPSDTRRNEEVWEQRIRNLKSHDETGGNVIARAMSSMLGGGGIGLRKQDGLASSTKSLSRIPCSVTRLEPA
jgi:hypothetical protein